MLRTSESGRDLETAPERRRRVFSAADKLCIVKEADRCLDSGERGALGAMLRREGLYSSLVSSWRTQLGAHGATGLAAKKAGRKPKFTEAERLNAQLLERNAELERKLHVANVSETGRGSPAERRRAERLDGLGESDPRSSPGETHVF